MRCCQLCGCTSWGPVGNPDELRRASAFLPDARVDEFVRCDGCKTVAKREFLQGPTAQEMSGGPVPAGVLDLPAIAMMKEFIAPIPPPPTRTERLVHTLLRSDLLDTSQVDTAQTIVGFARDLECALDAPPSGCRTEPTSSACWRVLSFASRMDFESWLTGLWDAVNAVHPGFTATAEYPDAWYDTAAHFALGRAA